MLVDIIHRKYLNRKIINDTIAKVNYQLIKNTLVFKNPILDIVNIKMNNSQYLIDFLKCVLKNLQNFPIYNYLRL